MYLWSIQEEAVWQEIQETGIYHCDPYRSELLQPMDKALIGKKLEPQFEAAYEWLAEQMEQRIGKRPEGVRFPVWAWYQYGGKRKSDLRKERWTNGEGGQRFVCLELEVPDGQVLLSEFGEWHVVLGGMCPIADTEEEWDRLNAFLENTDDATAKSFLHENWKRIFDVGPFKNEWTTRGEDVQATFWELKREYVKKARPFVTVSKKGY